MLKKKISLIFVIVMILNLASALCVTAQEAKPWTPPENIVPYGSFERGIDVLSYNAGAAWYNTEGANGTKGSLKYSGGTGAWRTLDWKVNMQKGETYTISFWAKKFDNSETMNVYLTWDGTASLIFTLASNLPITKDWTKYTFEYTATGVDKSNKPVDLSKTKINVRPNPGNHSWTILLDELCVTPHGDVEYDYLNKDPYERPELYTKTGLPEPKSAATVKFSDTENHWAERNIELLGSAGFVEGMGDGTFAPAANVTRAEWVKMMVSIFNIKPSEYSNSFKDISADDWYAEYIQTAYDCGLLDKIFTIGGEFNPNQPIAREEAAAIAWRVLEIKDYESPAKATNITDLGLVSAWAKAGTKKCLEYGVLTGYSDNTVKPQATITRAEAVSMFRRILEFENLFEVYVDGEFGSDENPGTIEAPLATVSAAKEKIQPCLEGMKNNITVYIKGGVEYKVNNPIEFTPEDSGCNGYNVIYTSYGDDKAILTSGRDYTSWQLHDGKNNIYKTFVGTGVKTRNVYINGIRARRARSESVQKAESADDRYLMDGFLNDVYVDTANTAFICSNEELLELSHPEDVEFVQLTPFYQRIVRTDKIEKTEDGRVKFNIVQPGFSNTVNASNHKMNDVMYCENAYELLDVPGEWFISRHDGYLYYIPREYENPANMIATIPGAENIIKMTGTYYNKVHNIKLKNLVLEYTAWNKITDMKYAAIGQNGDFGANDEYKREFGPGVIDVTNGIYVDVEDCVCRKSGGTGIRFSGANQYCNIIGNEVYDLAANGITLGNGGPDELTSLLPENFAYEITDVNILNNYVHDVGMDYTVAGGMSYSWPKNTLVAHNEITNGSYSGMHVGWGWNKYEQFGSNIINTTVEKNYIHDFGDSTHNDGALIYSLGATGYVNGHERAKIQNNYLSNKGSFLSYIYLDEGSLGWEVTGNVVDNRDNYSMFSQEYWNGWLWLWTGSIKKNFIHDNYTTVDRMYIAAPDNTVENNYTYEDGNWPEAVQKIKDEAGLEPEYLAKYPAGVQRLRLRMGDKRTNFMNVGETLQLEFDAFGRKEEKIPVAKDEVYYYSSDKSVATVDKNGLITALNKGECNIYVTYVQGDLERQKKVELVVGDTVVEITPPEKDLYLINGITSELKATGKTEYNQIVDIEDFEFEMADESIATVDENGIITPHALGTTTMKSVYRADGLVVETEHTVNVGEHTHDDTQEFIDSCEKIDFKSGDSFFNVNSWSLKAATESVEGEDGVQLYNKQPVFFNSSDFGLNKLVSFDMVIKNPNSWPSIALCATGDVGDFKTNDHYMIGFKPDIIEIQRWNGGKRTMIFGPDDFGPPRGPGVTNEQPDGHKVFEYGMRHTVTVGTFAADGGTRIILMIDGEPIIDYTDKDEGALMPGGYFGVYAYEGYFEMLPSTDKHN